MGGVLRPSQVIFTRIEDAVLEWNHIPLANKMTSAFFERLYFFEESFHKVEFGTEKNQSVTDATSVGKKYKAILV